MKKGYKIVMMNKNTIKIEAEEIPKVLQAIQTRIACMVKQGIFNPATYSEVVEDKDRETIRATDVSGHYTGETNLKPLEDIFEGIEAVRLLKTQDAKQLN